MLPGDLAGINTLTGVSGTAALMPGDSEMTFLLSELPAAWLLAGSLTKQPICESGEDAKGVIVPALLVEIQMD